MPMRSIYRVSAVQRSTGGADGLLQTIEDPAVAGQRCSTDTVPVPPRRIAGAHFARSAAASGTRISCVVRSTGVR